MYMLLGTHNAINIYLSAITMTKTGTIPHWNVTCLQVFAIVDLNNKLLNIL